MIRPISAASLALTSLMLGLVSVEPSANFTVGTTWLPPLTEPTNSAASGSSSMSTSVQAMPSDFSAVFSRAQIAAPRWWCTWSAEFSSTHKSVQHSRPPRPCPTCHAGRVEHLSPGPAKMDAMPLEAPGRPPCLERPRRRAARGRAGARGPGVRAGGRRNRQDPHHHPAHRVSGGRRSRGARPGAGGDVHLARRGGDARPGCARSTPECRDGAGTGAVQAVTFHAAARRQLQYFWPRRGRRHRLGAARQQVRRRGPGRQPGRDAGQHRRRARPRGRDRVGEGVADQPGGLRRPRSPRSAATSRSTPPGSPPCTPGTRR